MFFIDFNRFFSIFIDFHWLFPIFSKYFFSKFQETFNKVKANPPARFKRKAEKKRKEEEDAKRLCKPEENQSAIDPTTGQFVSPNQPEVKTEPKSEPEVANANGQMTNGIVKENGDCNNENNPEKNQEAKIRILLSGFVKSEFEDLKKMVLDLKLELTESAKNATHLVMPKLGRTISFLCAISYVKFILKPEWIRESSKAKKLLGESEV